MGREMYLRLSKLALLAASLLASLGFSALQPARAVAILDQYYDLAGMNLFSVARNVDYRGQTFTVGITGKLDSIRVPLGYNQSVLEPIHFFLAPIASNTILFSQSVELTIPSTDASSIYYNNGPSFSDWTILDFSPFDIDVQAGDQFALVFSAPVSIAQTEQIPTPIQIGWFAHAANSYAGGTGLAVSTFDDQPVNGGPWDQGFATYVSAVPEPSTWVTMIIGFGAIGFSLRRARAAKQSGGKAKAHRSDMIAS